MFLMKVDSNNQYFREATLTHKAQESGYTKKHGAGAMAEWSRAQDALPEGLGSTLSIRMVACLCDFSFRGSNTFFWPLQGTRHACNA